MIAISTAFSSALVAIDIKGKQDYMKLESSCKQSENILKSIDELLDKNNLDIKDNQDFAVVIGPGSFTGLRIGIAIIKGLAAGLNGKNKAAAISSLDLMAYEYVKQNKPKEDFACVINALSGLAYVCEYNFQGKKNCEEKLIEVSCLQGIKGVKIGLKGEDICQEEIELTPQGLLEKAKSLQNEGLVVDVKTLSPLYLRKSQAEDSLDGKNLKKS